MKLIISLTSPFARKARVVALEKQLAVECVVDIPWMATTQVAHFNPLGKVPVLEMDDGDTLFDSRVIVEYFDRLSPVCRLLPAEGRQLIRVKRWEALTDGISDAAALIFLERKRPLAQQDPSWITRQFDKITRGLAECAAQLEGKQWCVEDSYSLADICVGCALGYLTLRFPEIDWKTQYPNLANHHARLQMRSAFADTAPSA